MNLLPQSLRVDRREVSLWEDQGPVEAEAVVSGPRRGEQLEVGVDGGVVGALGGSGFDPDLGDHMQPSVTGQVPPVQVRVPELRRVGMEVDLQQQQNQITVM